MAIDLQPPVVPLLCRLGDDVRLEPCGSDPAANARWLAFELASLAEGEFGQVLDPEALTAEQRREWIGRLGEWLLSVAPPRYSTRLWIRENGAILGTLAVNESIGTPWVKLASLYVLVRARGRGIATRVLSLAQEAAILAGGVGIGLETSWVQARPLKLYLKIGFWVRHWKDDINLMRGPVLPEYSVEFTGDTATFAVRGGPTFVATRRGTELEWTQEQTSARYSVDAIATFAMHLAIAGFPLVRSQEAWDHAGMGGDVGGPELLAHKIRHWEAWARSRDRQVLSAPIPGLTYPSWEALLGSDE